MLVRPDDVLLGKYRIARVLGQGGMGVVMAALHLELGELFAIKLLLPAALSDPQAIDRFVREARAAAKLRGPHVAKVHDVGRLESGAPYMIMEYLDGTDLRTVMRSRGPLPVEEAVGYVLQACEAIAEAHAVGMVHRDVKPANLFLTQSPGGAPWLKVLDFGISKQVVSEGAQDLTATGMILGSPRYMSPEQFVSAKDVDARADIWSLGVVLYELLTGATPFQAGSLTEVFGQVMREDAAPPSRHRPDLPPALDAVVLRCLEKRPENRFATMGQLAAALRSFHSVEILFAESDLPALVPPPDAPTVTEAKSPGARQLDLRLAAPATTTGDSVKSALEATTAPGAATRPVQNAFAADDSRAAARRALGSTPGVSTTAAWEQSGASVVRSRAQLMAGVLVGIALLGGGGSWLAPRVSAILLPSAGSVSRAANTSPPPAPPAQDKPAPSAAAASSVSISPAQPGSGAASTAVPPPAVVQPGKPPLSASSRPPMRPSVPPSPAAVPSDWTITLRGLSRR